MPPKANIAHHIPGRLRITVAAARGDLPLLVKVAEAIRELAGVDWVQPSPLTGSLVVHYAEDRHADMEAAVRELGSRSGLFDLLNPPSAAPGG